MSYFLLLLEYIFRLVHLLVLKYNFINVMVLLLEYIFRLVLVLK